jgi:hypothetical protein
MVITIFPILYNLNMILLFVALPIILILFVIDVFDSIKQENLHIFWHVIQSSHNRMGLNLASSF